VATHVNYPVALAAGPDGALYVAASALGSIDPDGYILRIDPAAAGPTDVRAIAATAGGRNFSALHTDYFGDVMPGTGRATETPTAAPGTPSPAAAGGTTVELDAGDFFFRPNAVTIPAETPVTFRIENVSKIPHNFSIDELRVSLAIPPGQARRVTITAPAGRYAFYCNLPGHRAAGMVGTLTVR
jgi:nitrite reductase (NO-forming)